ncbi:MAG: DmsE family decaheme c-type cytochrome [Armatimonadetes bacterium]|nr:DmsE family decaheme c-type cytochrome [Armatimonadota bacterium]
MKRWGVLLGATLSLGILLACSGRLAGQQPPEAQATYVGSQICAGCHQDLAKEWEKLSHARYLMAEKREAAGKGCEECHGPGSKHIAGDVRAIRNPAKMKPAEASQVCLQCHRNVLKASEWHSSAHAAGGVTCTSCHEVHHATKGPQSLRAPVTELCLSCHPSQRAEFKQNSHHPVFEGRVGCQDCHDPHRRTDTVNLAKTGQTQVCVTCHTEKAGPYLFEHDATAGDMDEGCLTCHRPHGSPNASLVKAAGRGLCQQCHIDMIQHRAGVAGAGIANCWSAGCHSQVHGSNANPRFLR